MEFVSQALLLPVPPCGFPQNLTGFHRELKLKLSLKLLPDPSSHFSLSRPLLHTPGLHTTLPSECFSMPGDTCLVLVETPPPCLPQQDIFFSSELNGWQSHTCFKEGIKRRAGQEERCQGGAFLEHLFLLTACSHYHSNRKRQTMTPSAQSSSRFSDLGHEKVGYGVLVCEL